jgi:hypothetical protein
MQSIEKMFKYIQGVSLIDIKVKIGKEELFFPKFDKISFGNSFFRDFPCEQCGSCCRTGFFLILTKSDYDGNKFRPTDMILVNGETFSMYTENYKKDEDCPYLVMNEENKCLCSTHGHHQLTCHAPHRAVRKIKPNNVQWIKRQYGRNWAWKDPSRACPAKPSDSYSSFEIASDIEFFNHLENICTDLHIKNNCSELINELMAIQYNLLLEEKEESMF